MAEKTLREAYKELYEEIKTFKNAETKDDDFLTEIYRNTQRMEELTLKKDILEKVEEISSMEDEDDKETLDYKMDFDDLIDFVDSYTDVSYEAWSDDIYEFVERYLNGERY